MTGIPTDVLGIAIWTIDLVLSGIDAINAIDRLANGISARAQAENRDVTVEESALVDGLLAESVKRRNGQSA
jgi:hypothetical protein